MRRLVFSLILATLVLAVALPASAQVLPVLKPIRSPHVGTTYPGLDFKVAPTGTGLIHGVFRDGWPDGNQYVYYARSTDSGVTWTNTALTAFDAKNPAIARNGDTVVVVYADERAGVNGIYARVSTNAGASWGNQITLYSGATWATWPDVAIDSNYVHAVWSSGNYLYYCSATAQTLNNDAFIMPAQDVASTFNYRPRIFSTGETVLIGYRHNWPNPEQIRVAYKRVAGGMGGAFTNVSIVAPATNDLITICDFATDSTGDTIFMVYDEGSALPYTPATGNKNLYIAFSKDGGQTWSSPASFGMGFSPSIALDGEDTLHVVFWRSLNQVDANGVELGEIGYLHAPTPGALSSAETYVISSPTNLARQPYENADGDPRQGIPRIVYDADNSTLHATWESGQVDDYPGQYRQIIVTNQPVLSGFTVAAPGSAQSSGVNFSVTITATDQFGNTMTSYTGGCSLTVSSGRVNPSTVTGFTNGVLVVDINVVANGVVTLTAVDTAAEVTGSDTVEVIGQILAAGVLIDDFVPASRYNSQHLNALGYTTHDDNTLALDQAADGVLTLSWNAATDYWYTVLSDSGVSLVNNTYLVMRLKGGAGGETFAVQFADANSPANRNKASIEANGDTVDNVWTTINYPLSVFANLGSDTTFAHDFSFVFNGDSASATILLDTIRLDAIRRPNAIIMNAPDTTLQEGETFVLNVALRDNKGNLLTEYNDSLTITASVNGGLSRSAVTGFAGGQASLSLTATGGGSVVITATDASGCTGAVAVDIAGTNVNVPTKFTLTAPSSVIAGPNFQAVIRATDPYGTFIASFSGTVTITSDAIASAGGNFPPATAYLQNGSATVWIAYDPFARGALSTYSGTDTLRVRSVTNDSEGVSSQLTVYNGKGGQDELGFIASLQKPSGMVVNTPDGSSAFIYGNALAAMIFTHAGARGASEYGVALQKDYLQKAQQIFDAINVNQNGDGSFFDAYDAVGGGPATANVTAGNNAWYLAALGYYTMVTGDARYATVADKLADYIVNTAQSNTAGDTYGGLVSRPNLYTTLVTEHQAEGYTGLRYAAQLPGLSLNTAQTYTLAADKVLAFTVNKLFDNANGRFYTAYGVPNDASTDAQAWPVLAMGPDVNSETDITRALDYAWLNSLASDTINGRFQTGFGFYQSDADTIWVEGTGEMLVASLFTALGSAGTWSDTRNFNQLYDSMIFMQDHTGGFVTFSQNSDIGETETSLVGTAWHYFAEVRVNPFHVEPLNPNVALATRSFQVLLTDTDRVKAGVPFVLTLRALREDGSIDTAYVSNAVLSCNAGIMPSTTGGFVEGVRNETVTITDSGVLARIVASKQGIFGALTGETYVMVPGNLENGCTSGIGSHRPGFQIGAGLTPGGEPARTYAYVAVFVCSDISAESRSIIDTANAQPPASGMDPSFQNGSVADSVTFQFELFVSQDGGATYGLRGADPLFSGPMLIQIPYPDADNDGLVDGTNIPETSLKIYVLNEAAAVWQEVPGSIVDAANNVVTAPRTAFSIFRIIGGASAAGLGQVVVYPNPYRVDRNTFGTVKFDQLPLNTTKIEIYDLSGALVKVIQGAELTVPRVDWDLTNQHGRRIASGMYFYIIRTDSGYATGRLGVIR